MVFSTFLGRGDGCTSLGTGNLVEDTLNDDDADVNAAGDVRKELGDEVADGVEGVASEDADDSGAGVGLDARDVEVRDLRTDGIGEESGVVGNIVDVVALSDDGAGDGMEEAAGETVPCGMRW